MKKIIERDLFGGAIWDENAFPRAWVERMQAIINHRRFSKMVADEMEYRTTHNVFDESTRPMSYAKMCQYDNFLRQTPYEELLKHFALSP